MANWLQRLQLITKRETQSLASALLALSQHLAMTHPGETLLFPFTAVFPMTHILQVAVLGLELSFWPYQEIIPLRITRSHVKLSQEPLFGSSALGKTMCPQSTVYRVTLLAAQKAGLPG